ncbi:hypothetical protein Bra3105_06605 [Brachybacterium halotolerans subsp. kimchii]|uniref:hypothetical protein n=1 Tax=Brachybacterium halotolerans TaxID=2795215 RepID=UPI001E3F0A69|nr:hypothetical protein [Brachybacterium halotolerans]UEJ83977.1 hypothetical protein Bra3105_06605 [Brachybacterium halotolerans subsp. kimchii]
MTTLYREVLIETAEQAAALPDGTVVTREGHFAFQKYAGRFVSADPHDLPIAHAWEVVGWTALVPIEAEEERQAIAECEIGVPGSERITHHRRYVTPWEEA